MSLSHFSDDSHIKSILRRLLCYQSIIVLDSIANPDGDETKEKETVSTKCDALMCSDNCK